MQNKYLYTVVLLLVSVQILFAQQSVSTYRYQWLNLGMAESPEKTQVIQWRTDTTGINAVLQFQVDLPSPDLTSIARTVKAISVKHNDYGVVKTYHKVTLENLAPATKYLYRIGDGNKKWSEWFQFKTADALKSPFSFTYIADVQTGIVSHYPRVIRKSIEVCPESSFFLFTGDITERAEDEELNNFFYAMSWLPAMKPITVVPDNHEYHVTPGTKNRTELASVWGHLFSYPQSAPDSLARLGNYFFDYQGVRFIMINSKEFSDSEASYKNNVLKWLEEKLKNNPNSWTVVAHHQPMYSIADGRSNMTNQKYLKPLYDKYSVDLVLSGHDHGYSRIGLRGSKSKSGKINSPVYVVSVAGEQMYASQYPDLCDRLASNTQLFQNVRISDNRLNFKAYDATGKLYDEFELIKKKKRKYIISKIPDYEERTELPMSRKRKYTDEEWLQLEKRRQEYLKKNNTY